MTGPDATPSPEHDDDFGETRLHEPGDTLSRQEEDIALAAELLRAGSWSDRQIRSAVATWSIHGHISLAQHLQDQGLLNSVQFAELEARVRDRVSDARSTSDRKSASNDSHLLSTLERMDTTGRVAKLLGVTIASTGVDEARESETRYQLIRKLGQGGLGRVWLARDTYLNRHVALKEISHPSRASEVVLARFRHEAEITGRLEHPGIVPVYQLGIDNATGRAFYTMRFLGKETLQDSIAEYHERRDEGDEDPMLLRHLLLAFVSICHALGHAHSRRVIHRDLKPENIVIDSFGQVIVIDWGLAKVLDDVTVEGIPSSTLEGDSGHTVEGQVLGTPLYMAPEQAAGRLDEVDHRTDIYGLGAILFAIVTGQAPHESTQKHSVQSGLGASGMISSIAGGETPLASAFAPNVDPALEAICGKAMARRRYARYQAAADLAEDIQRWMAGEPVTAYREPRLQRARRWVARNQGLSQVLAALTMIILVALTTLAMATRQKTLDAQQSQFAEMEADVREIELQLLGVGRELSMDARFIASLPPIQGVVSARAGVDGDDETLWRTRLESIFTGLLRSNPTYLALTYVESVPDGSKEIVRVERNARDTSFVRQLPHSRLYNSESDPLLAAVSRQEPGDIKMSLEPRPRYATDPLSIKRLAVATPIYSDISGEFFGMAVIEADITGRIVEVLTGLAGVHSEVFIADGTGLLWASVNRDQGARLATVGASIPELPDAVAEAIAQPNNPFEVRTEYEYLARRIFVDPSGRGVLIFARLRGPDR